MTFKLVGSEEMDCKSRLGKTACECMQLVALSRYEKFIAASHHEYEVLVIRLYFQLQLCLLKPINHYLFIILAANNRLGG